MPNASSSGPSKSAEHVLYDASVALRLAGSHLAELEPGEAGALPSPNGSGPTAESDPADGTLRAGGGREGTRREGP